MKSRPILISVIIISLLVELTLAVLVFKGIGAERIPVHLGRLLFQVILIGFILLSKSQIALFLLASYHIIIGLIVLSSPSSILPANILAIYHIVIGAIIYFHDWLEQHLVPSSLKDDD